MIKQVFELHNFPEWFHIIFIALQDNGDLSHIFNSHENTVILVTVFSTENRFPPAMNFQFFYCYDLEN